MAEYLSKAMALAQDAAKLSLRFSEGLLDNALEFGLDTPGGFYDNAEFKLAQVRKDLGSGSDKEKLGAMKRLLAAVAKGHDASEYFADVVKNVASGNLEMRRLVYMYLLRYAEQEPDLALLSVNTFQRDLADSSQVIRAMALRVMSSIRVPVISPIVMLAIRKLADDRSPHVRKTAALAVPKLLRLDGSLRDELEGVVKHMMAENSPLAVGSVIQAFRAVCPTKYEIVHGHFRRWCGMLAQLDEWGQVELAKLLTAYARTQFADPATAPLEPDHELLLKSMHPLLQSRNSAVVMAAVSAYCHLAPAARMTAVAKPLVRLMRASRETAYVALTNILDIARRTPSLFHAHTRSFFVAASDPPMARRIKLRVLALLVDRDTVGILVPEIASYTRSTQSDVSTGAIDIIVRCAQKLHEAAIDCFQSLLLLLQSETRDDVASKAMHGVRVLLLDGTIRDAQGRGTMTLYEILCFLVSLLPRFRADLARAHVFALVREFARTKFGGLHALGVLRTAAKSFKDEGAASKMEILELSTWLMRLIDGAVEQGSLAATLKEHREMIVDMHAYLFTLARYDTSFDVRDRARTLRALCALAGDEAHSEELLHVLDHRDELLLLTHGGSMVEMGSGAAVSRAGYTVGSLSLTIDRPVNGYSGLSPWPLEKPQDVNRGTLFDGPADAGARNVGAGGGAARAITIAGISGRVQMHAAEYSTPRSVADDLDAFLNSDDAAEVVRPGTAPRVVYRQPSVSLYTSSTSSSSGIDSVSESESQSESESSSSEDEDNDKLEKSSGSEEESSDDERNPFMPSHVNDGSDSDQDSDSDHNIGTEHTRPLIEDTSKYWQ
ncbi:AP-3 complex subunit beta [Coemansia sp. RSA 2607]|nr:AP-3 complex subunit beta [Coemansia sp. RSA 2607]